MGLRIDFDLTERYAYLILFCVIAIYVGLTVGLGEMWTDECSGLMDCFDFDRRLARLYVWNVDWIQTDFRHVLHMGLLTLSYELFNNYKVLVLASSVLLLIVSYLLTVELSGKRIGGIISVLVILQSSIYYNYDTSITYPSFWTLLFITAVYLSTTKKQFLSPIPYVLSIPAKALNALYFPGLLGYLWLENKKKLFFCYLILAGGGFMMIMLFDHLNYEEIGGLWLFSKFDIEKFFVGFVSWMWKGFADDQITLMMLVVFGALLFLNRKTIPHAKSVLVLSSCMVLITPILTGLTTYDVWPYRMLSLVVMDGIIVGMVLMNLDKVNLKMFLSKA